MVSNVLLRLFALLKIILLMMQQRVRGEQGVCINQPLHRIDCYTHIENFPEATEEGCLAQGCCWKALNNSGIPCAFDLRHKPEHALCAAVPNISRYACRNPRYAVELNRESCHAIGCCFDEQTTDCFQPFFEGYELLTLEETSSGWRGTLVLRRYKRGPFGNDIPLLLLHVIYDSDSRIRVRITDPAFQRYEVPDIPVDEEVSDLSSSNDTSASLLYKVDFTRRPFGIAVTRRHTGEVLFNSTPTMSHEKSVNGLIFENQYLEISTHLEKHQDVGEPVLYGLGERVGSIRLRANNGTHYPMFARFEAAPRGEPGENLAGVHPFYLQMLDSGHAHGLFFLASNAMEVITQSHSLTFRVVGGILDFYVFVGPTVDDVTAQYTRVVGRPIMPPLWALGYHMGSSKTKTLANCTSLVSRMRDADVPLEVFWQDYEYMDNRQAFTLNQELFPQAGLQAFVKDLHFHNQYYVVLITSAIPTHLQITGKGNPTDQKEDVYAPFSRGVQDDVFVKGINGERYAEKYDESQWAVFVDFFHPNASSYWTDMLNSFYKHVIPFDGVWIDNNIPASTCDRAFVSANGTCQEESSIPQEQSIECVDAQVDGGFIRSSDTSFPFDPYRQPYVPGQNSFLHDEAGNLNAGTLPMAALHHSSLHYNVHSLYGHTQAIATSAVLSSIRQRRSVFVSRATFSGDGSYTGHALGDNEATWSDLRHAISMTIQMNIVAIPFSGANVCGYRGDATKELCVRWHQAASMMPLMRNHGDEQSKSQSPVDFDPDATNIIRDTILQRYKYLPYFYTQFYRARTHGKTVIRPLAFEFPKDKHVYDVETQFLVGHALMASPVVEEGAIATKVYFPKGSTWYDANSGRTMMKSQSEGFNRTLQLLTPLSQLQLHVRGGHIIPLQQPATSTTMTRRGAYRLLIALDDHETEPHAIGELFVDDGDSLHSIRDKRYSLISFHARQYHGNRLEIQAKKVMDGYNGPEMSGNLDQIIVFGVHGEFHGNSTITVNEAHRDEPVQRIKADYFPHANMLVLTSLEQTIGDDFHFHVKSKGGEKYVNEGKSANEDQEGDTNIKTGSEGEHERIQEEKHGRTKGLSTLGIVGLVVGSIFILGLAVVCYYHRRRGGYNPLP